MINLPHPSRITAGLTNSFEDFPDITRVEVISYLSKSMIFKLKKNIDVLHYISIRL